MASVFVRQNGDFIEIKLGGLWDFSAPKSVISSLYNALKIAKNKQVKITKAQDFRADLCGGALLRSWANKLQKQAKTQSEIDFNEFVITQNAPIERDDIESKNIESKKQIEIIAKNLANRLENRLQNRYKRIFSGICFAFSFFGELLYLFGYCLAHPRQIRIRAALVRIENDLIKAVPIINLACFLIGIIISYQAALQLARFGAGEMVVEITSMLTLREMSPVIAAIIVAGRSSSAFAAEIGMMSANSELAAMKVMGLNPMIFLVLPRIFALFLCFPLIVFIADIFGLLGGIFICYATLDISASAFLERFLEAVSLRHFFVGLVKAPFFGAIIAFIGCIHGFCGISSTRAIGAHTTKAVVEAIFCVILFDALCSLLFNALDL